MYACMNVCIYIYMFTVSRQKYLLPSQFSIKIHVKPL